MGIQRLNYAATWLIATTVLVLGGYKTGGRALDANNVPSETIATWERGNHSLPGSATQSGWPANVSSFLAK